MAGWEKRVPKFQFTKSSEGQDSWRVTLDEKRIRAGGDPALIFGAPDGGSSMSFWLTEGGAPLLVLFDEDGEPGLISYFFDDVSPRWRQQLL